MTKLFIFLTFHILILMWQDWRDGSVVKSTGYSSRSHRFNSQQPYGGSQPPMSVVHGIWRSLLLADVHAYKTPYTWSRERETDRQTDRQTDRILEKDWCGSGYFLLSFFIYGFIIMQYVSGKMIHIIWINLLMKLT